MATQSTEVLSDTVLYYEEPMEAKNHIELSSYAKRKLNLVKRYGLDAFMGRVVDNWRRVRRILLH